MDWDRRTTSFLSGETALAYCWTVRAARFETDVSSAVKRRVRYLPQPRGPGGASNNPIGGFLLCIPTNLPPERIELAFEAIAWMTSPEAMKANVQNGFPVAPRFSVAADPEAAATSPIVSVVDRLAKRNMLKGWPMERAPPAYDHRQGDRQCDEHGLDARRLCLDLQRTRPAFKFPGSAAQWNGLADMTDARVLGKQLVWASTTDIAKNEAYNIVNGDIFRWNWLWPRIAKWFGVEWEGFEGAQVPLEGQMTNDAAKSGRKWSTKYGLVEPDLWRVASPWHTDLDMGRPIEVMTDMALSRKLGFHVYQNTEEAFHDLFATLRAEKVIP